MKVLIFLFLFPTISVAENKLAKLSDSLWDELTENEKELFNIAAKFDSDGQYNFTFHAKNHYFEKYPFEDLRLYFEAVFDENGTLELKDGRIITGKMANSSFLMDTIIYTENDPLSRLIYKGSVSEDFQPSGIGMMTFKNGDTFQGFFSNGPVQKFGTKIWSADDSFWPGRYDGDWKDGLADGNGTLTWEGGITVKGQFENGYPDFGFLLENFETLCKQAGKWLLADPDVEVIFYDGPIFCQILKKLFFISFRHTKIVMDINYDANSLNDV